MDPFLNNFICDIISNTIFMIRNNFIDNRCCLNSNNIYNEFDRVLKSFNIYHRDFILNIFCKHLEYYTIIDIYEPTEDFIILVSYFLVDELMRTFEALRKDDGFYDAPYALNYYTTDSLDKLIIFEFHSDEDYNLFKNINMDYVNEVIKDRYEILLVNELEDFSI